jgi:alkylated DNA nucleotide flippase Atl1
MKKEMEIFVASFYQGADVCKNGVRVGRIPIYKSFDDPWFRVVNSDGHLIVQVFANGDWRLHEILGHENEVSIIPD